MYNGESYIIQIDDVEDLKCEYLEGYNGNSWTETWKIMNYEN